MTDQENAPSEIPENPAAGTVWEEAFALPPIF